MRKLFAVMFAFALVFTACDDGSDSGNGNNNNSSSNNTNTNGQTSLTIVNSSDFNSLNFLYGDADFGVMNRGQEVTKPVAAGTKFINFILEYSFQSIELIEMGIVSIHQMFEVNEVLTAEVGINNRFNFTNNTVVTLIGGDSGYRESGGLTTGTLRNIVSGIENYYKNLDSNSDKAQED